MINTTLCYIRRGEEYLMLHRVKKENDLNRDKWIGIGGKFLDKESPEDCLLREVEEETGLVLTTTLPGVVTFVFDGAHRIYDTCFTATAFTGELRTATRGCWSGSPGPAAEHPHWEGDGHFPGTDLEGRPFFSLKVCYQGDG